MYRKDRMKRKCAKGMAVGVLAASLVLTGGCGNQETGGDATQKTETQTGSESQKPEPESQKPESQKPETQTEQESQKPETQTEQESQKPETQDSETQKEDTAMQDCEIEILCPSEYTKRNSDVTYSNVIKTTYYSTTCEKNRPVNIVLPAGYSEDKDYPVLYVLHGIFGSQNDMNNNSVTIQNMMTKGIAKDMIVVYPYMYASKTQDTCTAIDKENVAAYDNFVNDLVTDLMPFMKENYSIAEGRENTAIAGFSMGGRESLAIGLQRPDLFGYVGAIAPAPGLVPGRDWAMAHEGQFTEEELVFDNEKPILLMICCGDKDGTVGQFPKSYHNIFEKNKVEHVWWEIPGSDHGDPAISSGIYNFCRYIFQ